MAVPVGATQKQVPSVPAFPQAICVEYDEQVDLEIQAVPFEIQVDPQA